MCTRRARVGALSAHAARARSLLCAASADRRVLFLFLICHDRNNRIIIIKDFTS
jgi:hypothetical protein